MPEAVKKAFEQMAFNRSRMLAELATWTESELKNHDEGQWNALQVVDHVITSEKGTLGYLMKKTKANPADLPIQGQANEIAGSKLNDALKTDRKWKAPDVLPQPKGDRSLEEMAAYWEGLQGKMVEFVSSLDKAFDDKLIFRHPIAGLLDLKATIEFLANHIDHHMHQLHRIKVK
ncbi:MAG: DinB family protein [Flavobacteriales bacterium]|nr:DinB family protein [Flavobacteriales bacterium]MDG2246633.1 DinB family protein [Flavobacteriales bacterium]